MKLEEEIECFECGFVMKFHHEWVNGVCFRCSLKEEEE